MKKIISLLCLLSMCLLFVNVKSHALDNQQVNQFEFRDNLRILYDLSILGDYDIEEIDYYDEITRGEAAVLVTNMLAMGQIEAANDMFSDVIKGTDFYNSINIMAEYGLINGYGDRTFRPDEIMTYTQMISVLVKALGYNMYAQNRGGYPLGYLTTAQEIGINKGAYSGEDLCWGDGAKLLVRALETNILKQTGFGDSHIFTSTNNVNLLSEKHNVYKGNGIITAAYGSRLKQGSRLRADEIELDSIRFLCPEDKEWNKNVGYSVKYYLKDLNDGTRPMVMSILVDTKNTVTLLEQKDIVAFQNNILRYYQNGIYRETSLGSTDVLFNGKASFYNADTFSLPNSRITLLDNNSDNVIDVVFVEAYVNYVVNSRLGESLMVVDKYGRDSIILGENDIRYSFYDEDGAVEPASLDEWSVLSIYADALKFKDGQMEVDTEQSANYKIHVSQDLVEGEVEEIKQVDGKTFIRIKNKDYRVNQSRLEMDVMLGRKGVFYLDAYGDIAAVDNSMDDSKIYGIFLKGNVSSGLDAKAYMVIFNQNGEKNTYTLRDKLQYNGNKTPVSASYVIDAINGTHQLISFELDENGEIRKLNSVEKNPVIVDDSTITKDGDYKNRLYKKEVKTFGGDCYLDDNTVLFVIPPDGDEDSYAVKKLAAINNNEQWYTEFYNVDDMFVIDVLFMYLSGGVMDANAPVVIIDTVNLSMNDEGENVHKINGFQNGNPISLYGKVGLDLSNLKRGDAIQYTRNAKNEIMSISTQKLLEADDIQYSVSGSFDSILQTVVGVVVNKKGTSVICNYGGDTKNRYDLNLPSIRLYDRSTSKIQKSSVSDIRIGDILFICNSYAVAKEVMIIR